MSEQLEIRTNYNHISDLAADFPGFVDGEKLVLYSQTSHPQDSKVLFCVFLADGKAVFEGEGVVTSLMEKNENTEHPYEICLDSLQLDAVSQAFFQRLSMTSNKPADLSDKLSERVESNVMEEDVDATAESETEQENKLSSNEYGDLDKKRTSLVDIPRLSRLTQSFSELSVSVPDFPKEPKGFSLPSYDKLTRPEFEASWSPMEAKATSSSRPSQGYFEYQGTIPIPKSPPRPDVSQMDKATGAPSMEEIQESSSHDGSKDALNNSLEETQEV